jgi:hypothetical protein
MVMLVKEAYIWLPTNTRLFVNCNALLYNENTGQSRPKPVSSLYFLACTMMYIMDSWIYLITLEDIDIIGLILTVVCHLKLKFISIICNL